MDAVAEATGAVLPVFDRWAGEGAHMIGTPEYEAWAKQGKTLLDTLGALGSNGAISLPVTPARARTRRAAVARARGRSGNGRGFDPASIIAALEGGPMSQTDLSRRLGASRQTIARHLERHVKDGTVVTRGSGAAKTWALKTPLAAAA